MIASADIAPEADQRVILYGIRWTDYEILLAIRGDRSRPRFTYLAGTLEIMSPSYDHEQIKKNLARLVEAWAFQQRIRIIGVGSWTIRSAPNERGLEPDECYIIGPERRDRPDIAIEVIRTSGGIDKLEVYRGLGVPEVWVWEVGSLKVWGLVGDGRDATSSGYVARDRSAMLPTLDMDRLAACALLPDQNEAVAAFLGVSWA